jgi:hypothetical protein
MYVSMYICAGGILQLNFEADNTFKQLSKSEILYRYTFNLDDNETVFYVTSY